MSQKILWGVFLGLILFMITYSYAQIYINSDVNIQSGCLNGVCNVTYHFNTTLSFTSIEIFANQTEYDHQPPCGITPPYVEVNGYIDIFGTCCVSNWVAVYSTCSVNDSNIKIYHDSNHCYIQTSSPPIDNGTSTTCNYCSPDIHQIFTVCDINSQQNYSYVDLNKNTCCQVTNLPSDCSINIYPYNSTFIQSCHSTVSLLNMTADCQKQPNLEGWDKAPCIATIPDQYADENFSCVSLVENTNTGEIIQVNPNPNGGLVKEDRTVFEPVFSKVNYYYTNKNLNPETEYTVRLECSSPQTMLYSEYPMQMNYGKLDSVFSRIQWGSGNAPYFIAGAILFVIIGGILIFTMRRL